MTPAVSFTRTLSSCPSVLLPHLLLPCPLEPGVPGDGAAGFWGELPTGDRGPDRFSLCRRLPADRAPPADGDGAQPARPAPPVPALPAGLEQLRSQLAGAGEGNVLVGGCWQHRTSGGEGCRSRPWFLGLTRNKSLRRDQKTPPAFFPVRSLVSAEQHRSCVEELSWLDLVFHYFWVLDVMLLLEEKAPSRNHLFSC